MMLYKLLSGADSQHFSRAVISLGGRSVLDGRIEDLGVPVYNLGLKPSTPPTPSEVWRLVALARRLKPDLIQGWMYHGSLAALVCRAAARRARVVWSIHSCNSDLALEKRLTSAVIRMCARLSALPSKIVYVSEASRRQHEAMGYRPKGSHVIPNGFDMTHFAPSSEARASVRAELGVSDDHLLVALVGRFHPMKDHINFLHAAASLSQDYHAAHFLMAGRGVDPDNEVLRRLVTELGLEGRAHLLGERGDISRLIAGADICSLSSSYGESFPLVVGEAMACGVPCVVTNVGDAAKLVGATGLVVPPRNSEALADGWRQLIRLGSDGRAQLGEAARERVRENFLLASVIAEYETLFSGLLHDHPSPSGSRGGA